MLLNLVIIFAGLIIVLFISILSYSKAYRIKNRIVEIIEKYEVYNHTNDNVVNDAVDELNPDLMSAGYDASMPNRCANIRNRLISNENGKYYDADLSANLNTYGYNYCVFEMNKSVNKNGKHYVVVTFIRFEVPIIGDVLTFPVYGETKTLGKTYDY
ncbi:MAG: hypothetical protein IKL65_05890 [Bacilli bacterium]|nr:hypothetical protein [Bacilli bacterium]